MKNKVVLLTIVAGMAFCGFAQNPVDKSLTVEDVIIQGRSQRKLLTGETKQLKVEENLTSQTGTTADVLRQMPALISDIEGGLLYRGSDNPGLYINGVPYGLLEEQSGDMLIQLPSLFFNQVSLTAIPPIEWMPEGDAGVINLASAPYPSRQSLMLVTLGAGLHEGYNAGAEVNLNPGKMFISAKYNYRHEYRKRTFSKTTTNSSGTTVMKNNAKAHPKTQIADLTLGYNLTERDLITAYGLFYRMTYDRYGKIRNNRLTDGELVPVMYRHRHNEQKQNAYAAETRWEHRFKKPGETLMVAFNYNNFVYDEGNAYQNEKPESGVITGEDNYFAHQNKNNYYLTIQYNRPFWDGWFIKAGHVSRFMKEHYNADANNLKDNNWVENMLKQDIYTFKRRTQFHYLMLAKEWDKLLVEVGAQGELNWQKIISQYYLTDSETLVPFRKKTSHLQIYPRAKIAYRINNADELALKYIQRVNRPSGAQMNPFIDRSDATYIRQGNPYLKDEIVHSFELSYQFTGQTLRITPAAYFRNKHNRVMEMAEQPFQSDETIWVYENVGHSNTFGLEMAVLWTPVDIFSFGFSGNLFRDEIDGRFVGYDVKKRMACGDIKANLNLWVTPTTEIQIDGFWVSNQLTPQGKIKHRSSLNAGVAQYFLDGKLKANLSINNIYNGMKETTIVDTEGLYIKQVRNRDAQVAWLTLTYHL